jgi:hypothetical protein
LREKKGPGNFMGRHQPGIGERGGNGSLPFMWEQKLMGKDDFSKSPMAILPSKTGWNYCLVKA